ncbi:ESX-1 secretion-associated protein [Nocardia sp. NBC_01503]|uniref:type VII secretion target n=1 Tax=Nocardia sp. NBC_01503 TaxID=2975997 RepID=UPI002E7BC9BB|nr:type VII secretion target [Nocardia sp. NBC_01503]WTL29553.1 ESX-1 secretion-associated protein [Nocardia sp. NBC_01503]
MNVLNVQPQTFRQYGDISEGMAATVAVAGAVDQAASIAAVVPVFGLIGQDFLASFAYAQTNHFAALAELVDACVTTAATSRMAAQSYEQTEANSVETFLSQTNV